MAYDTPVKREHPVSANQKVKREKVKREHPVSANQTPVAAGHIALEGTALALTGRDIFRHLKDARYVAVLAVTLGMASEQRLRVLSSQNPLEGAVFDAACSALVESAADALNCEIEAAAQAAGLSCNTRFSPGYGDLPLAVQPTVLATLNATRLCGITATPTNLLMPTKSITAFVGLFEGDPHSSDAVRSCGLSRGIGLSVPRSRHALLVGAAHAPTRKALTAGRRSLPAGATLTTGRRDARFQQTRRSPLAGALLAANTQGDTQQPGTRGSQPPHAATRYPTRLRSPRQRAR